MSLILSCKALLVSCLVIHYTVFGATFLCNLMSMTSSRKRYAWPHVVTTTWHCVQLEDVKFDLTNDFTAPFTTLSTTLRLDLRHDDITYDSMTSFIDNFIYDYAALCMTFRFQQRLPTTLRQHLQLYLRLHDFTYDFLPTSCHVNVIYNSIVGASCMKSWAN